ncbi:UNVERIFIED_CONTAM: hypothetical protein HCY01_00590 [Limosilactobacillus fermentum]
MPLIKDTKNNFGKQLAASNVRLARYLNIMAIYSTLGMGLIWSDTKKALKKGRSNNFS